MKMKIEKIGTAILMVALFAIAGCGSGSNSGNVNGNWSAVLTDANNNQAFTFTTSLVATNNGSSLTVSNFTFTTSSSCFVSGETESASFSLTGNFNGNVTGSLDHRFNIVKDFFVVFAFHGPNIDDHVNFRGSRANGIKSLTGFCIGGAGP